MKKKENHAFDSLSKADVERLKNLALSENGFLFDPVTGYSYNLNSTAITLLHQLQHGKTRSEILKDMQENYLSDANTLERDLDQFLGQLQEFGFLTNR